jgi:hypothetical protein
MPKSRVNTWEFNYSKTDNKSGFAPGEPAFISLLDIQPFYLMAGSKMAFLPAMIPCPIAPEVITASI